MSLCAYTVYLIRGSTTCEEQNRNSTPWRRTVTCCGLWALRDSVIPLYHKEGWGVSLIDGTTSRTICTPKLKDHYRVKHESLSSAKKPFGLPKTTSLAQVVPGSAWQWKHNDHRASPTQLVVLNIQPADAPQIHRWSFIVATALIAVSLGVFFCDGYGYRVACYAIV